MAAAGSVLDDLEESDAYDRRHLEERRQEAEQHEDGPERLQSPRVNLWVRMFECVCVCVCVCVCAHVCQI
jgi:hypothetical protein